MRCPARQLLLALCVVAAGCAQGTVKSDAGEDDGDGSAPRADSGPRPDAPPGTEVCDGRDNDDDQFIDEGTDEELCGTIANGTPLCNGLLGCQLGSCDPGWYDVDGQFDSGCECGQEVAENNDNLCTSAINLGDFPDNNTALEVAGNIIPASDVDYYRFRAVDNPDGTCDTFHVRAMFLSNPNNAYVLDVWRGSCDGEQVCSGGTDMQWYTNFSIAGTTGAGECPCGPSAAHHCADNTDIFQVRVRRKDGVPVACDNYVLEISNGKYPAP